MCVPQNCSVTVTGLQTVFAKNNKYGKSELILFSHMDFKQL